VRLLLQTDYSLRTLMYLAMRAERQTVDDIASFFQISIPHVAKVVHQLARLGFLRSIRGIGGGLELAKPASEITIGQIVRAVEGNTHFLECQSVDDVCVIQRHCKLRVVLDRAELIQLEYLDSIKLSDVLPFGPPFPDGSEATQRSRTENMAVGRKPKQVRTPKKAAARRPPQ
jgi:Rrf2 family transcriptional regulator, nitric oxide-sensitive transcriptional repressor